MNKSYRPGVYSRYDIIGRPALKAAGCAFFCGAAKINPQKSLPVGEVVQLQSQAQLEEYFEPQGEGETFCNLCSILLSSGVSKLYAVPLTADGSKAKPEQYPAAFAKLGAVKQSGVMLCDSGEREIIGKLTQAAADASQKQRERIAVAATDKATAAQTAREENNERLVLCCQKGKSVFFSQELPIVTAAAIAGMIAAAKPDDSFYYRPIKLLERTEELEEEQIEQMIQSGVTVLEEGTSGTECICCVTTRTRSGGEEDRSFTQINTVLMIDDIIRSVRERLSQLIRGGRTLFSPDSVASLAAVVLDEKKQAGYLSEFEPPVVYEQEQDPSVCVVELEFRLVSVLSRIYLTAHISL